MRRTAVLFDDVAWLGEEHAWCGPAARAVAGILIPKDDWGWWHHASAQATFEALLRAIPKSNVATWGGDEAVLSLSQWVEAPLAIDMARGFRILLEEKPGLRVKVARGVWEWSNFRNLAPEIRADLGRALPRERIVFEWPRDRRPPRPEMEKDWGPRVLTGPSLEGEMLGKRLAGTLGDVLWHPGARAADILIATSADELASGIVTTDLAIVLENDADRLLGMLDGIRVASGARCVVRLFGDGDVRAWLGSFWATWSVRGTSIDEAMARANQEEGITGEVVAANQTFMLRSGSFLSPRWTGVAYGGVAPPDLKVGPKFYKRPKIIEDWVGQRGGRVHIGDGEHIDIGDGEHIAARFFEVPSRLSAPEPALPLRRAFPPPIARVLNATVYSDRQEVGVLPKSGPIEIAVDIRPKSPLHGDRHHFPDELVEWEGESRTLQVHLLELDRKPITCSITVPRAGKSQAASFSYELVESRAVDLRLMVCDGVRILQTARFQGVPGFAFNFFIEAELTSVEQEKRPFDLALLVNDSLGNKPSATTLTEEGIFITAFEGNDIETLRDACRDALQPIVIHPDILPASAMLELANIGSLLLAALREEVPHWPASFSRVQLMTKSNAFFPFEYLYDGNIPESPDAELCPDRENCLKAGKAKAPCKVRAAAEVLCPMGFLGLTTIIERQSWDESLDKPMWLRLPQDPAERSKLTGLDRIIFAASNRANNFNNKNLVKIADVAQELGPCVPTWAEWKEVIATKKSSMLVAIVHIAGMKLQIGADEGLNMGALKRVHVGEASLAIIIGCNSALGVVPALSLPAIMKRNGVRVVVGSLTDVLGRYSNEAALVLATRFRDASSGPTPVTVGQFVTELRREFLAKNVALGLVLVAFGDADLALGG